MADIFKPDDLLKLIRGKGVLFIGDSNIRGLYKDLVWLSENCSYIPQRMLKTKLEKSYYGDCLVEGLRASRGRDFREVRHYRSKDGSVDIGFIFCTRVYSPYMQEMLDKVARHPPDLVVVNSCVWDISRWGPRGVDEYKPNMRAFLEHARRALRRDAMLVWLTAMPVSSEPRGGFLIKQVEFLRHTLRFDVMEANNFCASMVREYGYDVLDLHFHFRCLIHHRNRDGIHWSPRAIRAIINMLLTHVSLSWNRALPGRGSSRVLSRLTWEAHLRDEEIQALAGVPLNRAQMNAARVLHGDQAPGRQ